MSEPLYEPYDGDYSDGDKLAFLATDLLGENFTEAIEVALSLHGRDMKTDPPQIRVEATWNLDQEGWEYDKFRDIPENWTIERVTEALLDGYTAYVRPIKS